MVCSSSRRLLAYLFLCIFSSFVCCTLAAGQEQVLHSFVPLPHGKYPESGLVEDAAGNLYGTTLYGGTNLFGVIFELTPLGNGRWSQKVLHSFTEGETDEIPLPTIDAAGNLYGTLDIGGTKGCGLAYKLSPGSKGAWNYSVIHSFCANSTDGSDPITGLTLDSAGNLYGTTYYGGTYHDGIVFELSPSASGVWTEQILYTFGGDLTKGALPESRVVLDANGNIFGTTQAGGILSCYEEFPPYGCGTLYELTQTSGVWAANVLYDFGSSFPYGNLVRDSEGNFFGITAGDQGAGIYELQWIDHQWNYVALPNPTEGAEGPLTLDSAGNLYGETSDSGAGDVSVFELQRHGTEWSVATIYSVPQGSNIGAPFGGVVVDSAGNIFGCGLGSDANVGTIFELKPSANKGWTETTIYRFLEVDGQNPVGDLIADSAGNMYGVAQGGGDSAQCGAGVVFRLSPQPGDIWLYDIIYDFSLTGCLGAGRGPSGLTFDSSGNLYGTTQWGGPSNSGTVFKLSPTSSGPWIETTLYEFGAVQGDGAQPEGGLVLDSFGNLYGTTSSGGSSDFGSVFRLSPQSNGTWQETQLYRFKSGSDGERPWAGLTWDQQGNLYGTTIFGGTSNACGYACGTVFKLSPNGDGTWTESIIHAFSGTDGANPQTRLIFDSAGNSYGTAPGGGPISYAEGTVFRLTPNGSNWTLTTLYTFKPGGADGSNPVSDLTFDSAGNLYGTTFYGGNSCSYALSCGILFKLAPASSGAWTETIVHNFGTGAADGANPLSGVYIDQYENLFTMTDYGPGSVGSTGTVVGIKP